MFIAYFDETGDDGYPDYSSELFVLTSVYFNNEVWKDNYEKILQFRRKLKEDFKMPLKLEFHTKHFIANKKPYRSFYFSDENIKEILMRNCKCISTLDLKIINVVLNKKNIKAKKYEILDKAVTYNIQRIENDLNKQNDKQFIIITDEGRVGKMRKTTRKIQKINYIPSKYYGTYRQEIKKLIEDPLPKKSTESYFIQIADLVSYIVYLYSLKKFNDKKWANRVSNKISFSNIIDYLDVIKDVLNLEASSKNEYGVVHYPK